MENNKAVVFFGFLILVAVIVSTFNEYEITGQIARGGPGNLPRTGPGVGPTSFPEVGIEVINAGCEWTGDYFWVCETVKFSGLSNYYAKGFISGGEPLSKSKIQHESPFIYCQNVGEVEGIRAVHAYLFGAGDAYRALDTDNTVKCSKETKASDWEKVRFTPVARTFGPKDAFGTDHVRFEKGKPLSCDVSGYYKVVDRKKIAAPIFGCNGASGILKGKVSQFGVQYVYENPGPFDWREMGAASILDPPEKYHEGVIAYATSCDPVNYFEGKNYAKATAKIVDDGIDIEWEYHNFDTKPNIEFILNFDCSIEGKAKEKIGFFESKEEKKVVEEEPKVVEESIKEAPLGAWARLRGWFLGLF